MKADSFHLGFHSSGEIIVEVTPSYVLLPSHCCYCVFSCCQEFIMYFECIDILFCFSFIYLFIGIWSSLPPTPTIPFENVKLYYPQCFITVLFFLRCADKMLDWRSVELLSEIASTRVFVLFKFPTFVSHCSEHKAASWLWVSCLSGKPECLGMQQVSSSSISYLT